MEEWQQRVVEEKAQLDEKLKSLKDFIQTNELFKKLDRENQSLLNTQYGAMSRYHSILEMRIAKFKTPEKNGRDSNTTETTTE
jgi:hypothetical protein